MSFEEYAYSENRYRVLTKSQPEVAERLMAEQTKDVASRFALYKKLAEMQADCGNKS
jgi:pyruvate-ferredoxin/flavodoxin oxidoreductase